MVKDFRKPGQVATIFQLNFKVGVLEEREEQLVGEVGKYLYNKYKYINKNI